MKTIIREVEAGRLVEISGKYCFRVVAADAEAKDDGRLGEGADGTCVNVETKYVLRSKGAIDVDMTDDSLLTTSPDFEATRKELKARVLKDLVRRHPGRKIRISYKVW